MSKLNLLLICWGSAIAFSNPQVDRLFSSYTGNVPGAQVAIKKNGVLVYAHGYGLRQLSTTSPVTAQTNFRLASLTKQFTAMAILILVDQGFFTLDTRVIDLLPEFPSYGSKITVRHLLNHTGGLPDYEPDVSSSTQVSDRDVLKLLRGHSSLLFTPGSRYRYSNAGYVMLGLVVESTSGVRFSDFMRQQIFQPLGMSRSLMYEKQSSIDERAYGYTYSQGKFLLTDQSPTSATRGDGGVYTNAEDWAKWDEALDQAKLIPSALQKEMFTPATLNDGSTHLYGFGWELGQFQGISTQEHTGSTIGFRTAVQRYPSRGLSVLVLINRAGSSPWDLAREVAKLFW